MLMISGGDITDDPSIHYYVPTIPMQKPDLVRAIREQKLKSVSAVFKALGGGVEDPASKPALASLLITVWRRNILGHPGNAGRGLHSR